MSQCDVPESQVGREVFGFDLHHLPSDQIVCVDPVEHVGVLDGIEVLLQSATVGYPRPVHQRLPRGRVADVGI